MLMFAIPVFMVTILVEAAIAWRMGRRGVYDVPDAITSLHHGVLSQAIGGFAKLIDVALYVAVYQAFHLVEWSRDSVLVWIAALLLYDFSHYWYHRFSHEIPVLWGSHVVHHSSEYFNLSTALRQPATAALFTWIFHLPMALLGVPPVMYLIVGLVDLLYQYWVHTELVGRLGVLDRILVTPSNHRVHHGQNDYCIDRNYGGIFVLWDRMFGTFVDERDGEKIAYGVRKQLRSLNPLWSNLQVYADLIRQTRAARGLAGKLAVWFGRMQAPEPMDPSVVHRYDPETPRAVAAYGAVQYTLTMAMLLHFLSGFEAFPVQVSVTYSIVILVSCVTIGGVMEGSRIAFAAETVRLGALALASMALPDWFGLPLPTAARAVATAGALAAGIWLLALRRERRSAPAAA
jgi:sterol desaturase/sphingolipid hydroxylase (fatty acid hydroxylase superfamily)